jgi:hypothetical protein
MKTTNIICSNCGKEVEKLATEIKRQKKRGKKFFYCDLKCAGKSNCSHLEQYRNTDSILRIQQYKKHKDEFSQFRYHLNNAKKRAKRYKRECDIDLDYLKNIWDKQSGKCAVTGLQMLEKFIHTKKNRTDKNPYQASLDRIDNSKGYIKGNVRYVCLMFNIARNDFSDEQVLEFCNNVANIAIID